MLRNVPWRFELILAEVYFGVKGLIGSILVYGGLPLFFYHYGTSAAYLQVYLIVAFLPWSFKGLPGAVSDRFAIRGYHKRWYATGTDPRRQTLSSKC